MTFVRPSQKDSQNRRFTTDVKFYLSRSNVRLACVRIELRGSQKPRRINACAPDVIDSITTPYLRAFDARADGARPLGAARTRYPLGTWRGQVTQGGDPPPALPIELPKADLIPKPEADSKRFGRNFASAAIAQLVAQILTLAVSIALARRFALDKDIYGIYAFGFAFPSWFLQLVSLGLDDVIT